MYCQESAVFPFLSRSSHLSSGQCTMGHKGGDFREQRREEPSLFTGFPVCFELVIFLCFPCKRCLSRQPPALSSRGNTIIVFSIPGSYLYPFGRFHFVAAFGVVGAIAGFAWCPFTRQRPHEFAYLTHVRVFVENSQAWFGALGTFHAESRYEITRWPVLPVRYCIAVS